MWICNDCKSEFEEPEEMEDTYENFYGVSSMFPSSNTYKYDACPCCGSDDIEEVEEDDEEAI